MPPPDVRWPRLTPVAVCRDGQTLMVMSHKIRFIVTALIAIAMKAVRSTYAEEMP